MDGRLLLGLPINGQRYFDFKVHLLTIGDECNALEMIAELGIVQKEDKPLSQAEKMLMDLAYLIQQVEFVGVDNTQITPHYLLDNLATDDYVLINEAILALRKKHIAAGESQHQEDSLAATAMT
ncbi:hypothetical protein [Avibacterium paragallinarum]|uniref:Uncharacterized protein n=2 Tax=Avibacterium paragallinarum TaxID=728 RepID=A0ABU7QLL9_AVIPA|nr:hypothetical protein [Avibacterium paragallinarum]QZP15579.1 hypothetical protein K5O18_12670 [Avibacterium paragallinarum]QZP16175.1 hypothetical protein K5O18_02090 [Avibacterium paragallinarum]WAL56464.1 hypothetical protein OY678_10990 [Avibacterium paragallinarum]WAM59005.1 hypothetical protein OW731_10825 [Avibacterium paragallinarum]